MMDVKIILDGDGAFEYLQDEVENGKIKHGMLEAVSARPEGMQPSGLPSVSFLIKLDDGTHVFAETSLKLFQMAAAGFMGRYGDVTGQAQAFTDGKRAIVVSVPDKGD